MVPTDTETPDTPHSPPVLNAQQAREYLGGMGAGRFYRLIHEHNVPIGTTPLDSRIRVFNVEDLERLRREAGLTEQRA